MIERFEGKGGRRLLLEAMNAQQLVARKRPLARMLVERLSLAELAPDEVLIREGASDNDLYFVLAGRLAVVVGGSEVGTREAGQHVGEVALLDATAARSATVVAREQTVVAKISERDFAAVAEAAPTIWRALATGLSGTLAQRNRHAGGTVTPRFPAAQEGAATRLTDGTVTAFLRELCAEPRDRSAWDGVLRPGGLVGRFELVREVGRGGFGVVWEARDLELRREVAFKAMCRGAGQQLRLQRMMHEAEAAARLSHPNIVTLYDVGHTEQGAYLILELLRGETLARRLMGPRLPPEEALGIGTQIAAGLAHAHEHGVVHRDLKPTNVFLCEGRPLKVLDLGIALAFGSTRLVAGGTPAYMAPEQRRGAPEDERSDVFALGVLLHQMIAGAFPFPEAPGAALEHPPLLDVPSLPGLPDLVQRMLKRDPVERPRDAGKVLAELELIARPARAGAGAPPPSRAERRARRRGQRTRAPRSSSRARSTER
ncbi:MAG TPA: protein kinase [Anaeromyxobacteraceae bacterium]|nr:protein kinase [Anaeromyxobacteraceae bacterium]